MPSKTTSTPVIPTQIQIDYNPENMLPIKFNIF